jgi:hypothetical protein
VEDPEDREDSESREPALQPARSDLHPAEPGDGTVEPGNRSPRAGALAPPPEADDADRVQTAERGREAEAARANTSDSTPVPTETPAP